MKKIITSAVVAASLLSISASATGLNETSRGNYLVTPAYFAIGGYKSKIEVANTRDDVAVVAKVVIREGDCSQELLDFLIFLSPGDVFNAEIYKDTDGTVKIKSTDDSVDPIKNGSVRPAQVALSSGTPLIQSDGHLRDTNVTRMTNGSVVTVPVTAEYGYVEVFSLLEMNPRGLVSTWTPGTPLSKDVMQQFYDGYTTLLETNTSSTYGTHVSPSYNQFTDANLTDLVYNAAWDAGIGDQNITGVSGTIKQVLEVKLKNTTGIGTVVGAPGAATNVPATRNDFIDENLLTGTLSLINETSGQAMSVAMYGYNFEGDSNASLPGGIQNSILGERAKETNYLRVFGFDRNVSNNALDSLVSNMSKSDVFIPYTYSKESRLNMLFLAKNLSNYKCTFKNQPPQIGDSPTAFNNAGSKIGLMTTVPMSYGVIIRNMKENRVSVDPTVDVFSGGSSSVTPDTIRSELSQLRINEILTNSGASATDYASGWMTITLAESGSTGKMYRYDVNESLGSNDGNLTLYDVNVTRPALLPSYMQVIPVDDAGSRVFTNLYIPASRYGNDVNNSKGR